MQTQRVNRTDSEKTYMVVRNMSGATMNGNGAVCLDLGTTIDGISSVAPASGSFLGFVGIADADITNTSYGRVQSMGHRASVLVSHEGTSVTVTAGNALHCVNGVAGLSTSTVEALSTVGYKYVVAEDTATVSAAAYVGGIIRAL